MWIHKLQMSLAVVLASCAGLAGSSILVAQALNPKPAKATPEHAAAASKPAHETPAISGRQEAPYDPAPLARRVWGIMDLVEKNHIEPPTRQAMIEAGARALLATAAVKVPTDLPRRSAAAKSEAQFTALLREIWPTTIRDKAVTIAKLEEILLHVVLRSIPGQTNLLPPHIARVLEQMATNRYVGTGIEIAPDGKEMCPKVVNPARRGTFRQAGGRAGDLILEVDRKSTREVGLSKIVDWIRGDEGTYVTLVVRQPEETTKRTLRLVRAVVPFDSVAGYRRAGEGWSYRIDPAVPIGYIAVGSILSSTLHELRQIEPHLRAEGIEALVLDFRSVGRDNNQHATTLVAASLIDGGLLWRVRDARGQVKDCRAGREGLLHHLPLAVLISADTRDTDRAALAAALQDNSRAILVGETSAADGYVSTAVGLPDGQGAVAMRTIRLERAVSGRTWPVTPDVPVASSKEQRTALANWFRQRSLVDVPPGFKDQPLEDPQLARAVEILRTGLKKAEPQK
jgi:carboxyl-terminal processing protease